MSRNHEAPEPLLEAPEFMVQQKSAHTLPAQSLVPRPREVSDPTARRPENYRLWTTVLTGALSFPPSFLTQYLPSSLRKVTSIYGE